MKKNLLLILLSMMALISQNGIIGQTAGSLDLSFNSTGYNVMDVGNLDLFKDVLIQDDGKIVAVGVSYDQTWAAFIKATRFLNDGTIDTELGENGTFSYTMNYETNTYACALTSEGNIVIGGATTGMTGGFGMLLLQITPEGVLDSNFGVNGVRYYDLGEYEDLIYDITLQEDGKILVAGVNENPANEYHRIPVVIRFDENGNADTDFGINSVASVPVTETENHFNNICVQSDGRILASGRISNSLGTYSLLIARFNTNGSLDTSYGTNGIINMDINAQSESFYDMVCLENDDLILTGIMTELGVMKYRAFVMKFDDEGNQITDFGTNGLTMLGDTDEDTGYAMTVQEDGKILIGGNTGEQVPYNSNFGMWRLNANGSLDTDFGDSGKISTDFMGNPDQIESLIVQNDGKIIAVGKARNNSNNFDFAIARYFPSDVISVIDFTNSSTQIGLIPNPAQPNTAVQLIGLSDSLNSGSIVIYNTTGSIVSTISTRSINGSFNNRQFTLPSDIASGVYVVRAISDSGMDYSMKLVVSSDN